MTLTTTYNDQDIERLIDQAGERAAKQSRQEVQQALKDIDAKIEAAAERGAGIYYEKTKHDIELVLEAIDGMKIQVDKIPRIESDLAELKTDMKVVKKVVTDTNKDLYSHHKRLIRLEKSRFS